MTFNPTHEFLGHPLERDLELEAKYDLIDQLHAFRDSNGRAVMLNSEHPDLVTKIQPKPRPKPGEVWRLSKGDPGPLRGVDALGRLFSIDLQVVVWDPDRHHEKFLAQYTKVLNADGTPA